MAKKKLRRLRRFRATQRMFQRWLYRRLSRHGIREHTFLVITGVLIGLLAGFGNIAFRTAVTWVEHLWKDVLPGYLPHFSIGQFTDLNWSSLILLLPAALVLYLLARAFPGEVGGYGMPTFLEKVNLRGARISPTWLISKTLASAVTIGAGGSAGTEGPIAQLGGATGSLFGGLVQASTRRRKLFVAAGAAAAVAASFNAPIAGVLFAQEIILVGNLELASFSVIVISAATSTAISRWYFSDQPVFSVPPYVLNANRELLLYGLLGLMLGVLGFFFIRMYLRTRKWFDGLKWGLLPKLMLGAVSVGSIGLFCPEVLGDGYHEIQDALKGNATIWFFLAVGGLKILATCLTLSSGFAGGMFAPAMFIGAFFGGAFGRVAHTLFPHPAQTVGSYSLVGMGAMLAATTHAPLTAIFLLFEMTGNYRVILPAMITSVLGTLVCHSLTKSSIDTADLEARGIDLLQGRTANVLGGVLVEDVMHKQFTTIHSSTPFRKILTIVQDSRDIYFPVVDKDDNLTGILTLQDLRSILFETGLEDLVVAQELATEEVITLEPGLTLPEALEMFSIKDMEEMPVVAPGSKKILGMVSRRDLLHAYNRAAIVTPGKDGNNL